MWQTKLWRSPAKISFNLGVEKREGRLPKGGGFFVVDIIWKPLRWSEKIGRAGWVIAAIKKARENAG